MHRSSVKRRDMQTTSRRARILVVDDDAAVRRILHRALALAFEVVLAEGVADAVDKLEAVPFGVVLTDDEMMDGLGRRLLEGVRKQFPRTRRVLMSGQDVPYPPSERSSDPPWEHFVRKPFDVTALRAQLIGIVLATIPADAMWPKECPSCLASWSAEEWRGLYYVGTMQAEDGEILELRLCRCESTLALVVL